MLRRVLSAWVWFAGTSYLVGVALIVWFALDGSIIRSDPDCQPVPVSTAVYWICRASPFWQQFLVNALNVALTTTVWMPLFVASAIEAPEIVPFATALVFTNLVGLPAALFVLWRAGWLTLRALWDGLARRPVAS